MIKINFGWNHIFWFRFLRKFYTFPFFYFIKKLLISSCLFQCHNAIDFLFHVYTFSATYAKSYLICLLYFCSWIFLTNCFFIIKDGEITIAERDGAAHVLRCLKVWYDLSNDVLFTAINLVDRFLTKMKVRPKHMSCISVGSLHLAIKQLGVVSIDTEDLVAISQVSITFFFFFFFKYIYIYSSVNAHVERCVLSLTLIIWLEH